MCNNGVLCLRYVILFFSSENLLNLFSDFFPSEYVSGRGIQSPILGNLVFAGLYATLTGSLRFNAAIGDGSDVARSPLRLE